MSEGYRYRWGGEVVYRAGGWFFGDKEKWIIGKSKAKDLEKLGNVLKHEWGKIIEVLCKEGLNIFEKEQRILQWLTDTNKDSLRMTGSTAICLNHFTEKYKNNSPPGEVTYVVLKSIVGQNMAVNIKMGKPSWFFLRSTDGDIISEALAEYILAMPGVFLPGLQVEGGNLNAKSVLNNFKKNLSENADLLISLKSHRILEEFTITKIAETKDQKGSIEEMKIEFCDTGELVPYHKGFICGCIPIPGQEIEKKEGKEPATVKTPEMVVTSPNVTDALKSLSQVWQDKFAKSVLISAPPGSGKENFSQSILYGTGRFSPGEDFSNYTISFGDFIDGERQGELRERLFGNVGVIPAVQGLIAEADKKALYFDEVHLPDTTAGIRANLLRTLETDSYEPVGARKPEKVEDTLFVLATSRPLKTTKGAQLALDKIPPPDFWTRMTHAITIKHPFEGIWGEDFSAILDSYFIFFWFERLEKYFKIDPETDLFHTEENQCPIHLDQMKTLRGDAIKKGELLIAEELKKIAKKFRERMKFILREERIQPHELSIRGFKSMVTRLFSISADYVAQGYGFDRNRVQEHIDSVIYEILEVAKLDT